MTIADNEKNEPTKWFKCFWCPNIFLNASDLERHLQAAKTTGVKPNEYDHRVWWQNELKKREHEYLGEEGL